MIASQGKISTSEHWYTRTGTPMYTVLGQNGKERPTTLRDARSRGLVPSVTTVLNVSAKPALMAWMQRQVLMSALTLTRQDYETDGDFIDRVMVDSKELAKAAADAGTDIHNSIEDFWVGRQISRHFEHVKATNDLLRETFGEQDWVAEKSFGHDLGFGGKCDLHCPIAVVDIKTKEFGKNDKVDGYDEHLMQLAAYSYGLDVPEARCANIFVSRSVPGLVVLKEWTRDEINKGWAMFRCLLDFWQLKNGHK
jgi:hypothetical protein